MRLVRRLAGSLLAVTVASTMLVGTAGPSDAAGRISGRPWPGHPGRVIVMHTVRPGDTATGLAVRFHAWTDELLAINHLGRRAVLYVGERIRIPVVLAAVRRHRAHHKRHHAHHHASPRAHHHAHPRAHHPSRPRHHPTSHPAPHHHKTLYQRGWRHYRMSRTQVAHRIAGEARRRGVSPSLAQAIGWQESGWYQPLVSSAGAVGVMQLLPSTGRWMEGYVGRRLNLRDTWDNVAAGVELIRVLQRNTHDRRHAIGAYYEGLGGVRDGLGPATRRYVRNVRAIQRRLEAGQTP